MSNYEKAYEALHQPEVDEIMETNHQDQIMKIESDVWGQLQDGIEGGWLTEVEANECFAAWKQTYRYGG